MPPSLTASQQETVKQRYFQYVKEREEEISSGLAIKAGGDVGFSSLLGGVGAANVDYSRVADRGYGEKGPREQEKTRSLPTPAKANEMADLITGSSALLITSKDVQHFLLKCFQTHVSERKIEKIMYGPRWRLSENEVIPLGVAMDALATKIVDATAAAGSAAAGAPKEALVARRSPGARRRTASREHFPRKHAVSSSFSSSASSASFASSSSSTSSIASDLLNNNEEIHVAGNIRNNKGGSIERHRKQSNLSDTPPQYRHRRTSLAIKVGGPVPNEEGEETPAKNTIRSARKRRSGSSTIQSPLSPLSALSSSSFSPSSNKYLQFARGSAGAAAAAILHQEEVSQQRNRQRRSTLVGETPSVVVVHSSPTLIETILGAEDVAPEMKKKAEEESKNNPLRGEHSSFSLSLYSPSPANNISNNSGNSYNNKGQEKARRRLRNALMIGMGLSGTGGGALRYSNISGIGIGVEEEGVGIGTPRVADLTFSAVEEEEARWRAISSAASAAGTHSTQYQEHDRLPPQSRHVNANDGNNNKNTTTTTTTHENNTNSVANAAAITDNKRGGGEDHTEDGDDHTDDNNTNENNIENDKEDDDDYSSVYSSDESFGATAIAMATAAGVDGGGVGGAGGSIGRRIKHELINVAEEHEMRLAWVKGPVSMLLTAKPLSRPTVIDSHGRLVGEERRTAYKQRLNGGAKERAGKGAEKGAEGADTFSLNNKRRDDMRNSSRSGVPLKGGEKASSSTTYLILRGGGSKRVATTAAKTRSIVNENRATDTEVASQGQAGDKPRHHRGGSFSTSGTPSLLKREEEKVERLLMELSEHDPEWLELIHSRLLAKSEAIVASVASTKKESHFAGELPSRRSSNNRRDSTPHRYSILTRERGGVRVEEEAEPSPIRKVADDTATYLTGMSVLETTEEHQGPPAHIMLLSSSDADNKKEKAGTNAKPTSREDFESADRQTVRSTSRRPMSAGVTRGRPATTSNGATNRAGMGEGGHTFDTTKRMNRPASANAALRTSSGTNKSYHKEEHIHKQKYTNVSAKVKEEEKGAAYNTPLFRGGHNLDAERKFISRLAAKREGTTTTSVAAAASSSVITRSSDKSATILHNKRNSADSAAGKDTEAEKTEPVAVGEPRRLQILKSYGLSSSSLSKSGSGGGVSGSVSRKVTTSLSTHEVIQQKQQLQRLESSGSVDQNQNHHNHHANNSKKTTKLGNNKSNNTNSISGGYASPFPITKRNSMNMSSSSVAANSSSSGGAAATRPPQRFISHARVFYAQSPVHGSWLLSRGGKAEDSHASMMAAKEKTNTVNIISASSDSANKGGVGSALYGSYEELRDAILASAPQLPLGQVLERIDIVLDGGWSANQKSSVGREGADSSGAETGAVASVPRVPLTEDTFPLVPSVCSFALVTRVPISSLRLL